jgi:hypothetical protein
MIAPRGVGIYCGRGGLSAARARELRAAGVRHVALCSEAVSGWLASHDTLRAYADRVRAAGMTPHVYAFPGASRVRAPLSVSGDLLAAVRASGSATAILDAEGPYRNRPLALEATLSAIESSGLPHALTTFGLPSDRGTRWPWRVAQEWRGGWLGWQCYERAAVARDVRAGLVELRRTWSAGGVIPHIACYPRQDGGDGASRLVADLDRACLGPAGTVDVPGVWLWSQASLDASEARALAGWAAKAGFA